MRKSNLLARGETRRTVFKGFSFDGKANTLWGNAAASSNCEIDKGELRTGAGGELQPLGGFGEVMFTSLNFDVQAIFSTPHIVGDTETQKLGVLTSGGMVSLYDSADGYLKMAYSFGEGMRMLLARNLSGDAVIIFYGEKGAFVHTKQGTPASMGVNTASFAACFFQGRAFIGKLPHKLLFSAPYEPTHYDVSIDDGGEIDLPQETGNVVGMFSMKNKVFLLYEYGIAMLETGGSAREFRVKKLSYDGGKIFGSSAGVVGLGGEKAFFLAEDGLYVFNGAYAKRICAYLPISPIRGTQVCNHVEFEGKYFLQYEDEIYGKRGVIIDAETEEGYFAFTATGLQNYEGRGVCIFDKAVRMLKTDGALPSGEEYVFVAQKLSLGNAGKKTVVALEITGFGEMELILGNGKIEKKFALTFPENGGVCKVLPRLRGEAFSLTIKLKKGASVREIAAVTEVCKGVKGGGY